MLTRHVTSALEAYLDNQLLPEERRAVEAHLAVCPACAGQLYAARRLADELKPTLLAALGRPVPPPLLRQRVRGALNFSTNTPRPFWAGPGRVLNTAGALAVMALLAFGLWTVIQGQLPGANVLPKITSLSPGNDGGSELTLAATPTPLFLASPTPSPTAGKSSQSDFLQPTVKLTPTNSSETLLESPNIPLSNPEEQAVNALQPEPEPTSAPNPPRGTIAFAYFNQAPGRQVYEIHLVSADGREHRLFPLDGVSEPALHPVARQLAYRAYSLPTSPRSLLSGDLEGKTSLRIGGFWEDAQPDWSPTEDRLIYASKREADRRWRLYTSWGDGSQEKNLRREGESPTFAPDGFHFAFVSCDTTGNRCGLWVGDLETSEYKSKSIWEDPLLKAPDWSPVSAEIAYMANPGGNWDLFVVNSDGTHLRQLTDDPAIDGLPAWSPDGQWLAFLSNREENWGIWLLHVASGKTRRIYSFDGGIFTPPASPPYDYKRDWYDEQISWGE